MHALWIQGHLTLCHHVHLRDTIDTKHIPHERGPLETLVWPAQQSESLYAVSVLIYQEEPCLQCCQVWFHPISDTVGSITRFTSTIGLVFWLIATQKVSWPFLLFVFFGEAPSPGQLAWRWWVSHGGGLSFGSLLQTHWWGLGSYT